MLNGLSIELEKDLHGLQEQIFEKVGEEFNINSPAQLGVILFEKLGLPAGKKTKTGKWSTNEAELTRLAVKHEVPKLILDSSAFEIKIYLYRCITFYGNLKQEEFIRILIKVWLLLVDLLHQTRICKIYLFERNEVEKLEKLLLQKKGLKLCLPIILR